MTFVGLMMLVSGILAFVSNRSHVLNMLLSLEYIVLSLVWVVMVLLISCDSYYIMLYFFVFVVCEGALGLSLLVVLIRTYGSDLVLNMSLVQC